MTRLMESVNRATYRRHFKRLLTLKQCFFFSFFLGVIRTRAVYDTIYTPNTYSLTHFCLSLGSFLDVYSCVDDLRRVGSVVNLRMVDKASHPSANFADLARSYV